MSHTWDRLRAWLSNEYPELGDTLNFGILPQDLAQIEMSFGFALPSPVRESYLSVDGQEPESSAGCSEGLFFGLTLLPLEDVLEEWRFWREVDEDPNTGANPRLREMMQSIPPGWVRQEYSSRGWIPLIADKAGNYLGIDMHPGEEGSVGQVIVFGRDFDTKVVMWRGDGPGGWAKFLAGFVEDLESGEGFEMGAGNDGSEGSEDSVGYESYFYDGVGRGQGDGGGDSGTGGMRLAGEYKGWSVLEAWADRSVRRWQEAGLLPEPIETPPNEGKVSPHFRISDFPNVYIVQVATKSPPPPLNLSSAGAEIPIPVLSPEAGPLSATTATAATPLANATNRDYSSSTQPLPTISVTKAPRPRPVDVPTQDDILEADDTHFVEGDLEAGGNVGMREVEQPVIPTRAPQPVPAPPQEATPTVAAAVPLPASLPRILSSSPESMSPPAQVSDSLEEDPAPVLPQVAIVPPPVIGLESPETETAVLVKPEEESPVLVSSEDAFEKEPEATIRLIGGSGVSGNSEDAAGSSSDGVLVPEPEHEPVEIELETPALPKAAKTEAKPEKKKTLAANLKRFSQLGTNKRKKDSVGSLKEVV